MAGLVASRHVASRWEQFFIMLTALAEVGACLREKVAERSRSALAGSRRTRHGTAPGGYRGTRANAPYLAVLFCLPALATAQSITTVAGNGIYGVAGDGGPATAAQLGVASVAVSATGDLYVLDMGHNIVRKVTAATGIIERIAGTGAFDYSGMGAGDGGPATSASFYYPGAVAVDVVGNLYIADTSGHRVRKVGLNGIITTVAGNGVGTFAGDGGPAIAASLKDPLGLAVAPNGDLYISDRSNNRVRRVEAATGIITTIAGNGTLGMPIDGGPATASALGNPFGLTVRGNYLYIADTNLTRVRRVDLNSGIISTVAGSGVQGYAGDGGPATAAKLGLPRDVKFDVAGNMYIADNLNQNIRKVSPAGIISTYAGNGVPGYSGDGGPATIASLKYPQAIDLDGAGNLYIADSQNVRVRMVSAPPIVVDSTPPTAVIGALSTTAYPVGDPVSLDGGASIDNVTPTSQLRFVWRLAQVPIGSAATLDDQSSASAAFEPDVAGTYVVRLEVEDAAGLRSSAVQRTLRAQLLPQTSTTPLALKGQAVPGNSSRTFASFGHYWYDSGVLTFDSSTMSQSGYGYLNGIFQSNGVTQGYVVPTPAVYSFPGDNYPSTYSNAYSGINNSGRVFYLGNEPSRFGGGVYSVSSSDYTRWIYDGMTCAPGAVCDSTSTNRLKNFRNLHALQQRPAYVADYGEQRCYYVRSGFRGSYYYTCTGLTTGVYSGYLQNGLPALQRIVDTNMVAPGTALKWTQLSGPVLWPTGGLSFFATLPTNPSCNGIFASSGRVASCDDGPPGRTGYKFRFFTSMVYADLPTFVASSSNSSNLSLVGIYQKRTATSFVRIVESGTPAPGGGVFTDFADLSAEGAALVFSATTYDPVTRQSRRAAYQRRNGVISRLVGEGDPMPGGTVRLLSLPQRGKAVWQSEVVVGLGGDSGGGLYLLAIDTDRDGIPDRLDNCRARPNVAQTDSNGNSVGDACEDNDRDGIVDQADNCPYLANATQSDGDGDALGDSCDLCPLVDDPGQDDTDGDGLGDECDPDLDNDGVANQFDLCPLDARYTNDLDADGSGDLCDVDVDGDSINDDIDGSGSIGTFVPAVTTPSRDFSDLALGGTTFGVIEDNTGLTMSITDASDPMRGVRIAGIAGAGVGKFSACRIGSYLTNVYLQAGTVVTVTCGSLLVTVDTGEAEIELASGVAVSLKAGGSVRLDSPASGELSLSTEPGTFGQVQLHLGDDTAVLADGGTQISLRESAGELSSLAVDPQSIHGATIHTPSGVVTYGPGDSGIPIKIDIKPGATENTINLGSNGVIPVAILSSQDFDATQVVPTSVTLASAPVKLKGKGTPMASSQDVNGDGRMDLLVQVDTQSLVFSGETETAELAGYTVGGQQVRGVDTVRIVAD